MSCISFISGPIYQPWEGYDILLKTVLEKGGLVKK